MIDFLIDLDTKILFFVNSLHSPFWDSFMWLYSGRFIWVPMYASLLFVLFKCYNWRQAIIYVLAISLTILFADQLCASILRPIFERLRPANVENPISDLVHIVNGYRGGRYGFPSCHAANSFALAAILSLIFNKRRMTVFIFIWAFLNSYSRAYLGVHYPGDLIVGAFVGSFVGAVTYCAAIGFMARFFPGIRRRVSPHSFRFAFSPSRSITYNPVDLTIAVGLLTVLVISCISFNAIFSLPHAVA